MVASALAHPPMRLTGGTVTSSMPLGIVFAGPRLERTRLAMTTSTWTQPAIPSTATRPLTSPAPPSPSPKPTTVGRATAGLNHATAATTTSPPQGLRQATPPPKDRIPTGWTAPPMLPELTPRSRQEDAAPVGKCPKQAPQPPSSPQPGFNRPETHITT